jgi:tRNA threonylcarbamoyladenosine modification (KEOPS) complex  Pcc1 subunit
MSTPARAIIRLKFVSQKQISTILSALIPEAKSPPTKRARMKLDKDGLFLVLTVEAEDTVALRATLNAYLRWINSSLNVITAVEQAVNL